MISIHISMHDVPNSMYVQRSEPTPALSSMRYSPNTIQIPSKKRGRPLAQTRPDQARRGLLIILLLLLLLILWVGGPDGYLYEVWIAQSSDLFPLGLG